MAATGSAWETKRLAKVPRDRRGSCVALNSSASAWASVCDRFAWRSWDRASASGISSPATRAIAITMKTPFSKATAETDVPRGAPDVWSDLSGWTVMASNLAQQAAHRAA